MLFLTYPEVIWRVTHTTNAIEAANTLWQKMIKNHV